MKKELQQLGLHKTEIIIYLHILQFGISTPSAIAKATKIARPNTYRVLQSLQQKGLLKTQQIGKRKAYIATDPEALLQKIEEHRLVVKELLPELRALHASQPHKPVIRFFEGKEQIKELYAQTLSASSIRFIGSVNKAQQTLGKSARYIFEEWQKRNIAVYDLLSAESAKSLEHNKLKELLKGMYESHGLPKRYGEFQTDIIIWDENIAVVTLEEPFFGTIITNPFLATTFTTLFQYMWDTTQH